jgi:hypothetical protein
MTEIKEKDIKTYHNGHCIFDDINLCQKPGSGGHPGTIMTVDKIYCAKKVDLTDDNLELRFINNDQNQEFLKGFIPKFKGICDLSGKKYIMIENLKHDYQKPIALDLKIGFKSANKDILDLVNYKKSKTYKLFKQSYIDTHSTSTKYGYRAEGFEGDVDQKKISKETLKSMKPEKTFAMYFAKDYYNIALKSMIKQLRQLFDTIMQPTFNPYVLAGSSLLFIYDASEPSQNSVKMIDFSNSYVYTPHTVSPYNATFVESYRKAIKNLIGDLVIFLGNKEFKTETISSVMKPVSQSLKINKEKSYRSRQSRMSKKLSSQRSQRSYKSTRINSQNKTLKLRNSASTKKSFRV